MRILKKALENPDERPRFKIEELTEKVKEKEITIANLTKTKTVKKERTTTTEEKPVKKYDAVITTAITAIVSAIVAAIMALIIK